MRSESDGRLVANGYGVLVGYDYHAGKARPVPEDVVRKLELELAR